MPNSQTVSIQRCNSYDRTQVHEAVQTSIDLLGGIESFIKRGDRVLLKPNLLFGRPPEKAVTTHPAVIEAAARLALDCGAKVFVGDSPPISSAKRTCARCGVKEAADRLGLTILELNHPTENGWHAQSKTAGILTPPISGVLQDMDFIINLPKLKTHQQLYMTGAVKNLFGCVSGRRKAYWHFKLRSSVDDFAAMLLALHEKIAPGLTIVDGIVGMEGMGPGKGVPKSLGLIVSGADGIAVDCVIADLLGVDIQKNFILRKAQELGFSGADLQSITLAGESIEKAAVPSIEFPELTPIGFSLLHLIKGMMKYIAHRTHRRRLS
ncbi:MAG: DUF362 domain-containing protein [Candidatus Omnitrophica bacterium]|nr:DUF362 domain-containing protein [Candidatus Omnitrophota bacterium]